MRRALPLSLVAALLLSLAGGCAPFRLAPEERVPTRPVGARDLADGVEAHWPAKLRLRETAVLDMGGRKFPFSGFLEADRAAGRARIVGMADTGVTLFDLSVEGDRVVPNFFAEPLRRAPHLEERIGEAVRRIFLDPFPRAGDTLRIEPDFYRMGRGAGDGRVTFVLSGDGRLLAKSFSSPDRSWNVRLSGHRPFGALLFPGRIEWSEPAEGVRLLIRVVEVKRAEEAKQGPDGH